MAGLWWPRGKGAWARFAFTAAGVAVGVAVLMLCLSAQSALQGRSDRSAWQYTRADTPGTGSVRWLAVSDYFRGEEMLRIHVVAGPDSPTPGFPLPRTAQLVAVVGGEVPGMFTAAGIATSPDHAFFAFARIVLGIAALVLLVPVVVFVAIATRIAAARRERRLAALRLVGATRLQTALIAAAETALAAAAGTFAGWGAYEVLRRVLASSVTYEGFPFHAADVRAPLAVLALVPLLAVVVSVVSLRRVDVGPLGVVRRMASTPPTAHRVVPLVIGIGGLFLVTYTALFDELAAVFALATLIGVAVVGPWVCLQVGRLLARASNTTTALAARRIEHDPKASFRAAGALVFAAFAATYLSGLVSAYGDQPGTATPPGVVTVFDGRDRQIVSDGTVEDEERIRTREAIAAPNAIINTRREFVLRERRLWDDVETAVHFSVAVVVVVAGCGLAAGAVGGVLERRRSFALLRASGTTTGQLRRVVLLETGVPLVAMTVLGVVLGLVTSFATNGPLPTLGFGVVVSYGLAVALLLAATPLVVLTSASSLDGVRRG
ncbi:FtsX-like permease family protein [Lentzea sp. HUAS12]|uniref:FtsX-like permease family protein n=1 Tax=Lentzea sp. HUAS12 TaxID=2951806 RepID=UPI00209D6C07|nr:ABC transporter permease [Lentzea sp. HUAS12]USX51500.1 ABC transporter permease [Lentzea sp. HUAS12]